MIYRTQILAEKNCILSATQIVDFTTELRQEKSVVATQCYSVVPSTCVELCLDIDRGVAVETARPAGDVHIHGWTWLSPALTGGWKGFTGADIYVNSAQT